MKSAILSTKKAIHYVFITFDRRNLKVAPLSFATKFLQRRKKTVQNKSTHSSRFTTALLSLIARLCYCIVCGQFLQRVIFKYPHSKKSGIVRSGDRTGYGIPDAWKCSSLLINKQHIPTIRCHRTDFEMAWHHPFLSVQTLTSTSIVRQKCFLKSASRLCATLYNYCAESRDGEKGSFHASKEWSEKFKKQMSVHNLKGVGGSASAEHACGTKYIRR